MRRRTITRSIRQDYSTIATAQLIGGCTGGDAAAWHEFIRRFHTIIAITASCAARRWGVASPQMIDDLIEEAYLTFCADHGRLLRQFRFECADGISDFLKIVTANVVNDHFRALYGDTRRKTQRVHPTTVQRSIATPTVPLCLDDVTPAETSDRDPI
jgi:hypothetical protein